MGGVAVIVPLLAPLVGERLSQLALSEAVQFIVPPPALVTVSVLAAGLDPPAVPLKARLVGDTERAGGETVPLLKTTVASAHGGLEPGETPAGGVAPRPGRAPP